MQFYKQHTFIVRIKNNYFFYSRTWFDDVTEETVFRHCWQWRLNTNVRLESFALNTFKSLSINCSWIWNKIKEYVEKCFYKYYILLFLYSFFTYLSFEYILFAKIVWNFFIILVRYKRFWMISLKRNIFKKYFGSLYDYFLILSF